MAACSFCQSLVGSPILLTLEKADFVHILDVKSNFERRQTIDMFGEIAGACLSPDDEFLYISNAYKSLYF